MKKQIPARVDEEIQDFLRDEAKAENRPFSNHVETVLKKHMTSKKVQSHQPKQEYKP